MARATTTSDVFNAIAEPQRRRILGLLCSGEMGAGDIAAALALAVSPTSKHLRVLREVGLVRVRADGRERFYALAPSGLREVHAWVGGFEQFWRESFERLADYVEHQHHEEQSDDNC